MATKRVARELTVTASSYLTKNMLRITLHGEDLQTFPEDAEGAYFKLTFKSPDSEKPVMRTYTVANYRRAQNEIDVDFMLHGDGSKAIDGYAAPWAQQAKVGDKMSIFGPGPATYIHTEADWFLLAADMTALPALTGNLALLPADATGYLVIEILSEEDKQELPAPKNMEIVWVVNPNAGSDDSPLNEAIRKVNWLDGQVAIWAACEFKTMKKIRQYLREEKKVEKPHLYVSSYWKQGLKEEDHKVVKRDDREGE